ncbi:MAG: hypothetical protein HMLKMBBP_02276 [Planctomycetes bacterium]|nr:hypothetical protein [Planctomycetota bacterium]
MRSILSATAEADRSHGAGGAIRIREGPRSPTRTRRRFALRRATRVPDDGAVRGLATGLVLGLFGGVVIGFFLGREAGPGASAPTGTGTGTPAGGSLARADAASAAPPGSSSAADSTGGDAEPTRARARPVVDTNPPEPPHQPFADANPQEEIKDIATWPLARLMAALDAEMKRTTFGPHAGFGAFHLVAQVRSRFPEVVLPDDVALTFLGRTGHYPNAGLSLLSGASKATLAELLQRMETSGDPSHAGSVARLVAERCPEVLADPVARWLASEDERLVRIALACLPHARDVPAGALIDAIRRNRTTDPNITWHLLAAVPSCAESRTDLDLDAVEEVVVAALDDPRLRSIGLTTLGQLGGRGHAAAMRVLTQGELDDESREPVFRCLVMAGRLDDVLQRELDADDLEALIAVACTIDPESHPVLHGSVARRLSSLPVPGDPELSAMFFQLLASAGHVEPVSRAALDASLRVRVRRYALEALVSNEGTVAVAADTARAMVAAPGASVDLRNAVLETIDAMNHASRTPMRGIVEQLAANDPNAAIRNRAKEIAESLSE